MSNTNGNLVAIVPSSSYTVELEGVLYGHIQQSGLVNYEFSQAVEITSIVPSICTTELAGQSGHLPATLDDIRVAIEIDNTVKLNSKALEGQATVIADCTLRAFQDQLQNGRIVQLWLAGGKPTMQVRFSWRRTLGSQMNLDCLVSLLIGYRKIRPSELKNPAPSHALEIGAQVGS